MSPGALWLLLLPSLALAQPYAVGGKVKVYLGGDGEAVTVVPLQGDEPQRVLLHFAGTETKLDGRTLLHTVRPAGRDGSDFVREVDGRPYVTLTARASWGAWKELELHPPSGRAVRLGYSTKKSEDVDGQSLLDAWLRRRTSGDKATDEQRFADAVKDVTAACGAPVSAAIDWSRVKDSDLGKHDLGGLCIDGLRAVQSLCDDAEGKKAVATGVKRFTCRPGGPPQVTVGKGAVIFTTSAESPEQEAFVRSALLEKL
jgi:hypothetical protein